MSRLVRSALTSLVLFTAYFGVARADLELPRPSPLARVSLTLGLTDVTVEYSSPAAKGRKIFGALVPFDKIWRTGANMATKITFSKDVIVGDKPVAAGSYSLYTIPGAASWTVIVNKVAVQLGTTYKQPEDVARFEVKPKIAPMRERFTCLFSDYTEGAASLDLEWDKLRVSIPIKAKTDEQVMANIKAMNDGAWRPYVNAARYLLDNKRDANQALELVEKSLALHEDWLNLWVKAALLAQEGKYKDAYPLAQKAQALGEKLAEGQFFLAPDVKKALAEWKTKT